MLKQLMIASAVSAAFATSFAHGQQDSRNEAAAQGNGQAGTMSRNQDAPSGGVGQVFPKEQAQGSSAGSSGSTGSSASGSAASGETMKRNQDAPSGGVGQVFPENAAQPGGSAGTSGTAGASGTSGTEGSRDLMNRNQDAPSGGVGQVFPDGQSQSTGSTGSSGAGSAAGSTASGGGASNQPASAGASSGQRQGGAQGGAKSQGASNAPVYLLVPIEVASNDNSMKSGCWARIYSQENFTGDALTIVGPSTLPDMDQAGLFGLNWDDRVNSIELGPKAMMTVYDNENFRDMVTQFKPGQRVPDISTRTGFFDEFASVKIDCQRT